MKITSLCRAALPIKSPRISSIELRITMRKLEEQRFLKIESRVRPHKNGCNCHVYQRGKRWVYTKKINSLPNSNRAPSAVCDKEWEAIAIPFTVS